MNVRVRTDECDDVAILNAYDLHGFREAMARAELTGTVCLRFIDFQGTTVFNGRQCRALIREVTGLTAVTELPTDTAERLVGAAERVADGLDLLLWFIGD